MNLKSLPPEVQADILGLLDPYSLRDFLLATGPAFLPLVKYFHSAQDPPQRHFFDIPGLDFIRLGDCAQPGLLNLVHLAGQDTPSAFRKLEDQKHLYVVISSVPDQTSHVLSPKGSYFLFFDYNRSLDVVSGSAEAARIIVDGANTVYVTDPVEEKEVPAPAFVPVLKKYFLLEIYNARTDDLLHSLRLGDIESLQDLDITTNFDVSDLHLNASDSFWLSGGLKELQNVLVESSQVLIKDTPNLTLLSNVTGPRTTSFICGMDGVVPTFQNVVFPSLTEAKFESLAHPPDIIPTNNDYSFLSRVTSLSLINFFEPLIHDMPFQSLRTLHLEFSINCPLDLKFLRLPSLKTLYIFADNPDLDQLPYFELPSLEVFTYAGTRDNFDISNLISLHGVNLKRLTYNVLDEGVTDTLDSVDTLVLAMSSSLQSLSLSTTATHCETIFKASYPELEILNINLDVDSKEFELRVDAPNLDTFHLRSDAGLSSLRIDNLPNLRKIHLIGDFDQPYLFSNLPNLEKVFNNGRPDEPSGYLVGRDQ